MKDDFYLGPAKYRTALAYFLFARNLLSLSVVVLKPVLEFPKGF